MAMEQADRMQKSLMSRRAAIGAITTAPLGAKLLQNMQQPDLPKAAEKRVGIIQFSGSISDKSINYLLEVFYYNVKYGVNELWLSMNTYGGSIEAAMTFFNIMHESQVPFNTYISGSCQSSGIALFLSGNRRMMAPKSYIMMHNIFVGANPVPATERDFENKQKVLAVLDQTYVDLIVERSRQSKDKIRQYMRDESYFNAVDSKKLGFATEIGNLKFDGKAAFSSIIDDRINYHDFSTRQPISL
jgi:ATP-dependent protease ClpP protease subunit